MKPRFVIVTLVVVALAVSVSMLAQQTKPPANTKESGATSGHGMTAGEHTGKGGNVEQTIKALTEQFIQATVKADVLTYGKLVADDYIVISPAGTTATKTDVVARLKSGKERWDVFEISEMKVQLYGDTALVIGTMNQKGRLGDTDVSGQFRTVRVWVNRKGEWQLVFGQYTRIAQQR